MKMCQTHWDALRAAIELRGMSHLVARSGEAAHANMVQELQGQQAAFDPLMASNWAISAQFLKGAGLAGMEGNRCPLCEVDKQRAGLATNWIDGCTDQMLEYARTQRLVPTVQ